jgi:serine phosphatase RsbU (regulator of sigma subunit)
LNVPFSTPFTTQSVAVAKGSCLYLITDGLADQFGSSGGKKLRYKPIMETLVSSHGTTPDERHKKTDQLFLDWKGELEQVDDICIIELIL